MSYSNLRRLTDEEAGYSKMPNWMRAMMPEPDYGVFVWTEEPEEDRQYFERLQKGAV